MYLDSRSKVLCLMHTGVLIHTYRLLVSVSSNNYQQYYFQSSAYLNVKKYLTCCAIDLLCKQNRFSFALVSRGALSSRDMECINQLREQDILDTYKNPWTEQQVVLQQEIMTMFSLDCENQVTNFNCQHIEVNLLNEYRLFTQLC